jgi:ribonuclease D
VRDDLLVEIARRNPDRERDLAVIRGLPHRHLAAIMDVVNRVRALPEEDCPTVAGREQDPPQVPLLTSVLSAVLSDFCARNQLAASLVANSQDVKLLIRSRLQGEDLPATSLLCQGWRSRHVLPQALAVLEGRRTVRVADIRAEAPLIVEEY